MEELNNEIDSVVGYIKESSAYQKCIKLKKQMDQNDDVKTLIKEIKILQKRYVNSGYDEQIKKDLDCIEEELSCIPIYNIYNQALEEVNLMIDYVKDSLNQYFYELLNNKRN